jgi:hypothetical protein
MASGAMETHLMAAETGEPRRLRACFSTALAVAVGMAALLYVQYQVSPPDLLTTTPAVYQDEYLLMGAAVSMAEGQGLVHGPSASTAKLTEWFDGAGNITPGIQAGFSVALGTWFRMFGIGIVQARAFCYAMGIVAALAVFLLGLRWWNLWAGLVAALLLIVDPTFWYASRQVRPESFTVACYLLSAVLISLRSDRWRHRLAVVAGLLFGFGLTGHPCGFVAAPVVLGLALVVARGLPPWRYLLRFMIPATVIAAVYVGFLASHRSGVKANLAVHDTGRDLHTKSLGEKLAFERSRYQLTNTYENSFAWAHKLKRNAYYGWGLLVACSLVALWKRRAEIDRWKFLLFAGSLPMMAVVLAILTGDNNYLYLVNLAPWLYLASAAGIVAAIAILGGQQSRNVRVVSGCVACVALVWIAGRAMRDYRKDLAPYRTNEVIAYEQIEALIAERVPSGALVLGNQSAWLAAKRAGAEYLYSELQVQWRPPYRRSPIHSRIENAHVAEYQVDVLLLRQLAQQGVPVYYVLDMWDWNWNCCYPFGRYAPAFLEFKSLLERDFVPEMRLWTRDRGFVVLYRLRNGESPAGENAAPLFVERRRYRVGRELTGSPAGVCPGTVPGGPKPVAEYTLEPDKRYWVHVELHLSDGGFAIPAWSGSSFTKWAESSRSIPLDTMARAADSRGDLTIQVYPTPRPVALDKLSVRELLPWEADFARRERATIER